MAIATPPTKLSGLARTLIAEKLLSEDEATDIQSQANTLKAPFISQLILSKKSPRSRLLKHQQKPLDFLTLI